MEEFELFIEETIMPLLQSRGIKSCTMQRDTGEKVIIKADKHGYYKMNFSYVKNTILEGTEDVE